jgi:hypothetical protein
VINKFLFALVGLAVSLQGFAAVAMPFCQHQPAVIHHTIGQDSEQHVNHSFAVDDEARSAMKRFACDDCAFCQLCAAPAIPAVPSISLPEASPPLITAAPAYFSLFVPEQPQRPPLSSPV